MLVSIVETALSSDCVRGIITMCRSTTFAGNLLCLLFTLFVDSEFIPEPFKDYSRLFLAGLKVKQIFRFVLRNLT